MHVAAKEWRSCLDGQEFRSRPSNMGCPDSLAVQFERVLNVSFGPGHRDQLDDLHGAPAVTQECTEHRLKGEAL